jgi:hypothetical protein
MLLAGSALAGCANEAGPIRADGQFDDWKDVRPIHTDPPGDATGAFDVTRVQVAGRGTTLFVHFDTPRLINVQNGLEEEGTLIVQVRLGDSRELNLDLRNRKAYLADSPEQRIPWADLGFVITPTHASDRFELRCELGGLGVEPGETVAVQLAGSDSLDSPVTMTLSEPPNPPIRRLPDRLGLDDIRVVSLNTWLDGLADPKREDSLRRLLEFADGDIYCFQEGRKSETDKLANRMAELLGGRPPWVLLRHGDCVIATRWKLTAVPADGPHYAVAVVHTPTSGPLLVMSIHPDAGGYIGDRRDRKRVLQVRQIVRTIERFRAGTLGLELRRYRNAPIVVVGDYNLVGSREPMNMLEAPGVELTHWKLRNLVDGTIQTWRAGGNETFAPGMLDCVAYDARRLQRKKGFILDTAKLTPAELNRYNLQADDSRFSDHLMLVSDFQVR